MIPGTTPTYILTLKGKAQDKTASIASYLKDTTNLRVILRQGDVVIEKETNKLTLGTAQRDAAAGTISAFSQQSNGIKINTITAGDEVIQKVYVTLTQEESNKFLYKKGNIEIQLQGILKNSKVWKTKVAEAPVDRTLTRKGIE